MSPMKSKRFKSRLFCQCSKWGQKVNSHAAEQQLRLITAINWVVFLFFLFVFSRSWGRAESFNLQSISQIKRLPINWWLPPVHFCLSDSTSRLPNSSPVYCFSALHLIELIASDINSYIQPTMDASIRMALKCILVIFSSFFATVLIWLVASKNNRNLKWKKMAKKILI